MLSVKELHRIAKTMKAPEFVRQLGPFALVQRPPDSQTQQKALQLGAKRTAVVRRDDPKDELSLLFEFDDLLVATLPPVADRETLTVGRLPDCDVVIDDPSVSKHHATLEWDPQSRRVLVEDQQSSNGTHLNGEQLHTRIGVKDGDTVSFGEARFCVLLTETLYLKLTTGRFRAG
ncbi:MAG: FHA domain-containing protein [Archangiaceae bacterium]|nr:FHA domain-containing protein [Archangiaceae bacterium]